MEEQQQQPTEEMALTTPQWTAEDRSVFKWSLAGTSAVMLGADVIAHWGLTGLLFGLPAAFLLSQSAPNMYKEVKDFLPWTEVQEVVSQAVNHHEVGSRSLLDRAMGRNYEGKPKDGSREVLPDGNLFDFDEEEDEEIRTVVSRKSDVFRFSELLAAGFVPSVRKIFVGRTMEGKDIFVAAEDLCHIALSGRTGGGKGSLMRLLMVQLCAIGADMVLLNPHYMKWVRAKDGPEFDEDWTPFEGKHPRTGKAYLKAPPVECADIPAVVQWLEGAVRTKLRERIVRGRDGGVLFRPYFIVVDEWPDVVAEMKNAAGHLGKLLREGRKYGIFIIVASQDYQVKTIGVESGSVRKCFLTTYYTGGDATTVKELLAEPGLEIKENELGKGVVYLKCVGTKNKPVLVRVPFVDNESVYCLLGPSTFKKATQSPLPRQERQQPTINTVPTVKDAQNVAFTLEEALQLAQEHPEIDPMWFMSRIADYRETDTLPEQETVPVMRSPYYEQTGALRVDQVPTMVQPVRKSSPALPVHLQQALDAHEPGMSYRDLGKKLGIGKDAAGNRIEELKRRKLI